MAEPEAIPVERRAATRTAVLFPVTLDRNGEVAVEVVAANISATGLFVRSAAELLVWGRFTVTLPDVGMRDVRIVRRDGDGYGCLFPEPLTVEELDAVLASAPAVAGVEQLRREAEAPPPPQRRKLQLWRR